MDGNDDDYENNNNDDNNNMCIYKYTYVYIYIGETPQCFLWFSLTSIDAYYPHDLESHFSCLNYLKPAFLLVNS